MRVANVYRLTFMELAKPIAERWRLALLNRMQSQCSWHFQYSVKPTSYVLLLMFWFFACLRPLKLPNSGGLCWTKNWTMLSNWVGDAARRRSVRLCISLHDWIGVRQHHVARTCTLVWSFLRGVEDSIISMSNAVPLNISRKESELDWETVGIYGC